MALLFAAAFATRFDRVAQALQMQQRAARSRAPGSSLRHLYSTNKFKPHQGKRECARRSGGQEWLNFKAADRIRRGLPVSWPYQQAGY